VLAFDRADSGPADALAAVEAAPARPHRPGTLPHALDLHRFLLSGAPALEHVAQGQRWRWGRRG
jgi:hypothetical protein